MSTPDDINEERTEEKKQCESHAKRPTTASGPMASASRRNLVVIVAAVAVFAIVVIVFAFFGCAQPKK